MIFPIGDDQVRGGHWPLFSYAFIALNVAVFAYQAGLNAADFEVFVLQYGNVPVDTVNGRNYATLFTSMFLHGSWMHLIGNMVFLWIFADNIESTVGNTRFVLFYFMGGLAAHAGHIVFNIDSTVPTVGASGAIAAVMGAYLVMYPASRIRMLVLFFIIRIPAFVFLLFWIFQQVSMGNAALQSVAGEGGGVAWWAHIGGFVFGVLMGGYYRFTHPPLQTFDRNAMVWIPLLLATTLPLQGQNWCATAAPLHLSVGTMSHPSPPKTVVTIPVVVHVVWRTEAERLTEAQVLSQLDVLNEDFRAANADIGDVLAFYQPVVADMELQFQLADQDLNGQPHSGIIYRQTNVAGIGAVFSEGRRRLCHDELGGSTAWCTSCYLNIWVADLGLPGVAGIGIFPTQVGTDVRADEDGVYIQSNRFGRTGTVQAPYQLGRTTTHEVGHYLNLLHPWGAQIPPANCSPAVCCSDAAYDDFVADTRPQVRTYQGQCPAGNIVSCPPWPDNYNNFMGFADDACSLMFTQGQKERVWTTLNTLRPTLLDPACLLTCTTSTVTTPATPDDWAKAYIVQDFIVVESTEASVVWQVYGMDGRRVLTFRTEAVGTTSFGWPTLPQGIYVVVAQSPTRNWRGRVMEGMF